MTFTLDRWAKDRGASAYDQLPVEDQAALRARLQERTRANTYDPATATLTVSAERAEAFEANARHYADVFEKGRPEYAIPAGTLTDPARQRATAAFFFWTSWACATNRPDLPVSYTQNWPHEPLIGNIGLLLMVTISLLPVGLMQTWATMTHGTWYARSPEFLQTPTMQTLRWLRIPGDTIFAVGVLAMGWFKLGLLTGHSFKEGGHDVVAGQTTEAREPVGAS